MVKIIAPPDIAGIPLKKAPIVQPMPKVAPSAIRLPPINPFINSPFGGILKANSFDKRAPINDPITKKRHSIP